MIEESVDIFLPMQKKIRVPKTLIKWTQQAKECFDRKCQCNGCKINKILETKCVMKHIVEKIYEQYGAPPKCKI
jgi:hypothetical protein